MASSGGGGGAAAAASSTPGNDIRVEEVYDQCAELLQDGKTRLARNVVSRNEIREVLRDQGVASSYT